MILAKLFWSVTFGTSLAVKFKFLENDFSSIRENTEDRNQLQLQLPYTALPIRRSKSKPKAHTLARVHYSYLYP